jgi:hypothetical protein
MSDWGDVGEYFLQRMQEAGATPENAMFWHELDVETAHWEYYFAEKRTKAHYGDVLIRYPTLDKCALLDEKKLQEGKTKGLYVERVRHRPENMKQGRKYTWPKGQPTYVFFPPNALRAHHEAEPHHRVLFTEGEFTAFRGDRAGLSIVGLQGINVIGQEGSFFADIKRLLRSTEAKEVVFLLDSDLFELGNNEKDEDQRPKAFAAAVRNFRAAATEVGVDMQLVWVRPEANRKLGLDDLLNDANEQGYSDEQVVSDLEHLLNSAKKSEQGKWFEKRAIDSKSQVYSVFGLQNAEQFAAQYQDKLARRGDTFVFSGFSYTINEDGAIEKAIGSRDQIQVMGDCMWKVDEEGNEKALSNCVVSNLYLIRTGQDEGLRVLTARNADGETASLTMPADKMTDFATARGKFFAKGRFMFYCTNMEWQLILDYISRGVPEADQIHTLGWHRAGFWAWSNGLQDASGEFYPVDKYGVVSYGGYRYYLPYYSQLISEDDQEGQDEERRIKYVEPPINFAQWAAWMYQAYGDNGIVAVGYYIAALFRDLIYDRHKFFPLLMMAGPPRTGKSTMARSLTALYGLPQPPQNLGGGSTPKSYQRKMAQIRDGIVWMDEYKNTIPRQQIEMLKGIYDGSGYARAQKSTDNKTQNTPVLSSAIVSGQELPAAEGALFSRCILLSFEQDHFSEQQVKAFNELQKYEVSGLSGITGQLLQYRGTVAQHLQSFVDDAIDTMRTVLGNVDDRLIKNNAVILAPLMLLENKDCVHTNYSAKLIEALTARAQTQTTYMDSSNELSVFWQLLSNIILQGRDLIQGRHYDVKHDPDTRQELLLLNLKAAHGEYRKEAQRQGMQHSVLGLPSLKQYVQTMPYFIDYRKSVRWPSKNRNTSAYVFDLNLLRQHTDFDIEEGGEEEPTAQSSALAQMTSN